MVGAGTGIAPYRSFWQQRKWEIKNLGTPVGLNGNAWGEMILYFGCRFSKLDELYKDEIEQLVNEGIISSSHIATSRDIKKRKVNLGIR